MSSGLGIAEADVAAGKKQRRENGEQRNYEKTRTPDSRPDQQDNVQNRYREEEQAENEKSVLDDLEMFG